MLKMLGRIKYNNLILPQEDTFFFQITKEAKIKNLPNRDARKAWGNLKKVTANHRGFQGKISQKKTNKMHHKGLSILGN